MKIAIAKKKKCSQPVPLQVVARVAALLHRHTSVQKADGVVVAVSGGSDSLALLHILKAIDLDLRIVAVYIDHGLRPLEIPGEQSAIATCCLKLAIPFLSRSIDVQGLAILEKRSTEDAARILRYAALEEIRREQVASWIAVGHTADDQIEQFFLRLLRGSSRKALAGMQINRGHIIRPVLRESKVTLQNYLEYLNIHWCQDSSNLQRDFLRNRVRLDLLPMLAKEFNPNIGNTILQTMDILTQEEAFLEEHAASAYDRCVVRAPNMPGVEGQQTLTVDCSLFAGLHPALRRRIMEKCCWFLTFPPSCRHVDILADFIMHGDNGGEIHLGNGVRAEKRGEQLFFYRCAEKTGFRGKKPSKRSVHFIIEGPGSYAVPETGKEIFLEIISREISRTEGDDRLFVALEKITFPLLLRSPLPGELFHPCNGIGRKKVNRYFTDRKIPARDRAHWPVLLCAGEIIALPGSQIDHRYRITDDTTAVLAIRWQDASDNT